MIEVEIKRLWHGYASVRNYIVWDAMMTKQDLSIECKGEIMFIPHKELHKGRLNFDQFKSKHDDREYSLIDFLWKPDKEQKLL